MTNIYQRLLNELNKGKKAVMVTIMRKSDKGIFLDKILYTEEELYATNRDDEIDGAFYLQARQALEAGELQFSRKEQEISLLEPYFSEPHLIVLGGGHIAKPLAEFGAKVGFSVTVIDDRPSFANKARFPDAQEVICESFEKCFNLLNINKSSFVVIVTRGHRHDLECLRQVLQYDTAYTGMIGSCRRVREARKIILDEGYDQERLDKLQAPIGLEIGAVTPEEIALSIIAQAVSYRRLSNGQKIKASWPEIDMDVLLELGKQNTDPKALVTIVGTKGSVPRKAGAKMLVWPEGKIVGSIGGGCSEGEVINTARDVIRNGNIQVQDIDMTGSVAEDEGMVCGGIMKVMIEYCGESENTCGFLINNYN